MSKQHVIQSPPECSDEDPFIKQGCRDACTYKTCAGSLSYWSYLPSFYANGLYMGLFALSLIAFIATIKLRKVFIGFSITMIFGNVLELVGYAGRILAHEHPFSPEPFLMQIIGLTLAPAFYAAGIYFCLSRIVISFGADNSRIAPAKYPYIFITCDILSLLLQAAGGGIAASAKLNDGSPTTGANVLIAGLSFQVFTMLMFIVLVADFGIRTWMRVRKIGEEALDPKYAAMRSSKQFRGFLFALTFATMCIFARCVYRVAELAEGWGGHLMKTQAFFVSLEGAVVVAAVLALNISHPAFCISDSFEEVKEVVEEEKE